MSRAPSLLILASLSLLALGPVSAMAATNSESFRECDAAGGTYTKSGSDAICVFREEKVSSPNANPDNNAQTTQDTTTGQGNLGNKPVTECTGPAGQCKQ
jgi:hypothetical protein